MWPIAGLELGAFKKNFSYRILEYIEYFNYKKADLVLGQSEEILNHVTSLYADKKSFLYRNYPDFKPPKIESCTSGEKIKLVYAGLLGVAQGVNKLCQNINYTNIEFHIYGAGAEQTQIEAFISENKNLPIFYHGEISREDLHKKLLEYDITIIPLLNRIYGSVPSKIFEYARLGLPMIYFGGGEGENIIRKYHLGWVAKSGNYNDLNARLSGLKKEDLNLNLKNRIKTVAELNFDFEQQLSSLEKVI